MKCFKKLISLLVITVMVIPSALINVIADEVNMTTISTFRGVIDQYGKYNPGYEFNWKGHLDVEYTAESELVTKLTYDNSKTSNNPNESPKLTNEGNLGASGNIVIEGSFKIDNYPASKPDFNPVSLGANGTTSESDWYRIGTVYVNGGEIRALGSTPPNKAVGAKEAGSYDKICNFDSSKTYTLKLRLNVDGDASTYDTYSYELSDGTNTYKSEKPYYLGYLFSEKWGETSWNLTTIDKVVFGVNYNQFTVADGANPPIMTFGTWTISKINPITATVNIADNQTKVDKNSEIIINFSEAIKEDTLGNIKLYKGSESDAEVEYTYTLSDDKKKLTVKPVLEYSTKYVLKVPMTVLSADGIYCAESEISFYTDVAKTLEPISTFRGVKNEHGTYNPGYEFSYKGHLEVEYTAESESVTKLTYDNSKTKNDPNESPKLTNEVNLGASGNIVIEGSFKIDNYPASKPDFNPVSLGANGTTSESDWYRIGTVYVNGGEIRALGSTPPNKAVGAKEAGSYDKICNFDSSKTYTLKLRLNVDGDASTYDTYSYELSDGTNTYKSEKPYYLGYLFSEKWGETSWNLTTIDKVVFGVNYNQFTVADGANPPIMTFGTWTISKEVPAARELIIENISAGKSTSNVAVSAEIKNLYVDFLDCYLIAALYNSTGDTLYALVYSREKIGPADNKTFSVSLAIPDNVDTTNMKVKIFAFDDLDKLTPMAVNREISVTE